MTTAQALITAAYRELNIIARGTAPTTNQSTEALARLNAYIASVYGFEIGEPLSDWGFPAPQRTAPYAANFPQAPYPYSTDVNILSTPLAQDLSSTITPYPPRNSRVVWGGIVNSTLYFPESPSPGTRMGLVPGPDNLNTAVLTLDGNGRYIRSPLYPATADADQFVPALPIAPAHWFFRDDIGVWVPISNLSLTSDSPFPQDFDDFFIVTLAIRLAPGYNKTVSAESQKAGMDALKRLKARYRQEGTTVYGSFDFPRSLQSYISGRWYY